MDAGDSAEVRKYKEEHKNYRLQWQFPHDFPSPEVYEAFASPLVDQSREPFSWAVPDVDTIVAIMTRVGGLKKDEVLDSLLPALKQYGAVGAFQRQTRLTTFLPFADRGADNEKRLREGGTAGDGECQGVVDALRVAAQAAEASDRHEARKRREGGKKGGGKRGTSEERERPGDTVGDERESVLEGVAVWRRRDETRGGGGEEPHESLVGGDDAVAVIKSERMLRAVSVLERRRKQADRASQVGEREGEGDDTHQGRRRSTELQKQGKSDSNATPCSKSSTQEKRKRALGRRTKAPSHGENVGQDHVSLCTEIPEGASRREARAVVTLPNARARSRFATSKRRKRAEGVEEEHPERSGDGKPEIGERGARPNVSPDAEFEDGDGFLVAEMEQDLATEDVEALAAAAEADLF